MKTQLENSHLQNIQIIFRALKFRGFRLTSLIPAIILALVASAAEGLTFTLLIPTIDGIIKGNFQHVRALPVINWALDYTPSTIEITNRFLAIVLVLLTFLSAVARNIFSYFAALTTSFHMKRFAHILRTALFERYLTFGKLFFDLRSAGQLQQILTTYVSEISAALTRMQSAFYSLATLIAYLVVMFIISWKLTALVFVIFPILHFLLKNLISKISSSSTAYTASNNQIGRTISNILQALPLVKAFSNEKLELERFQAESKRTILLEFSVEKKYLLIQPIQEIILLVFLLLLLLLMSVIVEGRPSDNIADFAVYLVVLKRCTYLFGAMNTMRGAIASTSGVLKEISSIFNEEDKFHITSGTERFTELTHSICFNNLSFTFPNGTQALKNLTFEVKKGHTTALVGKTGSGKSTIINLLMRFYDVEKASLLIDGRDIRDLSIQEWRASIALVSQDTQIFNSSLRDNLLYGLNQQTPEEELMEALKLARLEQFVSNLPQGLDTPIGDRGVTLSGGERQRISIARAILKNCPILLLDEATSALDATTENLIQSALEELMRGRTTLVIAHRLSTVRKSDHVVVLEDGVITEQGNWSELLKKNGALHEYYSLQFDTSENVKS